MKNFNSPSSGFTLLEVLISIALLSFISLGIYQATTNSYELRQVLLDESNFYNEIRLSMGILDRDYSLLYSPTMIVPAKKRPSNQNANLGRSEQDQLEARFGRATKFWDVPIDQLGIRPSRVIGREDSVSFVAASNIRVYKESPESEFLKVTYELRDDPDAEEILGEGKRAKMLVRVVSPNVFGEDDEKDPFKKEYPLLHGIQKFTFRYYHPEKERWEPRWDSESAEFKHLYPEMLELKMEVAGPSRLLFEGTYKFKTEIPISGIDASF